MEASQLQHLLTGPNPIESNSVVLNWDPKMDISVKHPDDAIVYGSWTTLLEKQVEKAY